MTSKDRKKRERDMKRLEKDLHFIVKTGRDAIRKAKQLEKMMLEKGTEEAEIALKQQALDTVVRTFKNVASPTTTAGKVLLDANGGSFDLEMDEPTASILPADPLVAQLKQASAYAFSNQLEGARIADKARGKNN